MNLRPGSTRRRRYFSIAALLVGLLLIAVGLKGYIQRRNIPVPPVIDYSTDLDPAVVKAIEFARRKVLREPKSGKAWGFMGQVLQAHFYPEQADYCYGKA